MRSIWPFLINRLIWLTVSCSILVIHTGSSDYCVPGKGAGNLRLSLKTISSWPYQTAPKSVYRVTDCYFHTMPGSFMEGFQADCTSSRFSDPYRPCNLADHYQFYGRLGTAPKYDPFTSWYIRQTVAPLDVHDAMTIFSGNADLEREDYGRMRIYNTLPIPNCSAIRTSSWPCPQSMRCTGTGHSRGMITQIAVYDFYDIELDYYVKQLFGVDFFNFSHMAIIVLFIQTEP